MSDQDDHTPEGPDDPAAGYREPDPEADLPDPESELPNVPSVDVPEPPDPDLEDVPDELLQGFWSTVLLLNATLLAGALGVLLFVFDVDRTVGALLVVLAALLARRSYRRYRALDERQRSGDLTVDGGGDPTEHPDPDDERNG